MNTLNKTTPTDKENHSEIDLLDLLLIITSNIKTLIFFIVIGSMIGVAFTTFKSQSPKKYTSTSSVYAEKLSISDITPKMKSEILISAINTSEYFSDLRNSGADLVASLGKGTRLVNIESTAPTPELAQSINQKTLEKIFSYTIPSDAEANILKTNLENEKLRLEEIKSLIKNINIGNESSHENITLYGELLEIASKRESIINQIQRQLTGIEPSDIIFSPMLTTATNTQNKILPILAGIISGSFIALLWIFLRHALKNLRDNPDQREKWVQIKANLGLKN